MNVSYKINRIVVHWICWTIVLSIFTFIIMTNGDENIRRNVKSINPMNEDTNGQKNNQNVSKEILVNFDGEEIINLTSYDAGASKNGFIVGNGICQCGRSPGKPIGPSANNDIPWTATLFRRDETSTSLKQYIFCGGTLINDLYILTASHCVEGLDFHDIFVSLNDDIKLPSSDATLQKYSITKIIVHAQYNSKSLTHDIALLKLSEPIDFIGSYLLPACLPISNDQYHSKYIGTITRWVNNVIGGRGNTSFNSLQKIKLPLISNDQCSQQSIYKQKISENMICAGSFNNTKSCQGDSGGPLTITLGDRQLLVGIASWGLGCSQAYSPSIYTRVAKYITWILDHTGDAEWCIE